MIVQPIDIRTGLLYLEEITPQVLAAPKVSPGTPDGTVPEDASLTEALLPRVRPGAA